MDAGAGVVGACESGAAPALPLRSCAAKRELSERGCPVDGDRLAADLPRLGAGEEGHRSGDLRRLDHPPRGQRAQHPLADLIGHREHLLGGHHPRQDRVDRDPGCEITLDVARDPFPPLNDIDVCVANAGITTTIAPAHKMTAEQWQRDIDVNLTGAFRTV